MKRLFEILKLIKKKIITNIIRISYQIYFLESTWQTDENFFSSLVDNELRYLFFSDGTQTGRIRNAIHSMVKTSFDSYIPEGI